MALRLVPRTGRRRLRKKRVGFNELRRGDEGHEIRCMVIPRDPESSNLMLLLDWRAAPELRMPHNKKQLSSCDRSSIRTWIRQGAKDN